MGFNSEFKGLMSILILLLKHFSCVTVGEKTLIISRCTIRLWKLSRPNRQDYVPAKIVRSLVMVITPKHVGAVLM